MLLSMIASLFSLPSATLGDKKVEIKPTVAKTKSGVGQALAVLGGLLAGNFTMAIVEKFAPSNFAPFSPVVTGPGVIPHFIAGASDNWKAFGNGVMAAGGMQAIRNGLSWYSGKPGSGITDFVKDALPSRGSFAPIAGYDGQSMMLLRGAAQEDERLALGDAGKVYRTAGMTDEMLSM